MLGAWSLLVTGGWWLVVGWLIVVGCGWLVVGGGWWVGGVWWVCWCGCWCWCGCFGGCFGGVVVVVVVVVRTFVLHERVCPATRTLAPNSGGRTPGSKLPASPPPLPPWWRGSTRPCTCVQGTKNYVIILVQELLLHVWTRAQSGTTTGMPTSLSKKSGPMEHHEDELHLRHLHCDAHQDQGNCRCTQRARQLCPRAALVESPRELQRAATVETRQSSPRQHPENILILHNRDVEHFVNGLQLDNLYGQLKRQPKGAVSAPRQE